MSGREVAGMAFDVADQAMMSVYFVRNVRWSGKLCEENRARCDALFEQLSSAKTYLKDL